MTLRPGTKQILVPLRPAEHVHRNTEGVLELRTQLQSPFLPLGLMLWGTTPATRVCAIQSLNYYEAGSHLGELPGSYFEEGRSFAELERLAASGDLAMSMPERKVLEMRETAPGELLGLVIRGPVDQACFWGLTYKQRGPLLTQVVTPAVIPIRRRSDAEEEDFHCYQGQVVMHELATDTVLSNVYAPSEESVARLLIASRHPERAY